MQYLKLPPTPCYCCRVQLILCIIQSRFFSGMVQYMLVFSTLVEVVSERHLVKSSYPSKYSNNSSGKILSWIVCLPAGCPGSVCMFGIFLSTRKVLSGKLVTVSMLVGRSIFSKNMNIAKLSPNQSKFNSI